MSPQALPPDPDRLAMAEPGYTPTPRDIMRPSTIYDSLAFAAQTLACAGDVPANHPNSDPVIINQLLDLIEARAAAIRAQFPLP